MYTNDKKILDSIVWAMTLLDVPAIRLSVEGAMQSWTTWCRSDVRDHRAMLRITSAVCFGWICMMTIHRIVSGAIVLLVTKCRSPEH